MTRVDRWLQQWRISKVRRFIPQDARVLDIGCHEGELFRQLSDRVGLGVGVDPLLEEPVDAANYRLLPGNFPDALAADAGSFDVITMLAVLEHVPTDQQKALVDALHQRLEPGGVVVITVPAPFVDRILAVLRGLRLIHGMSLEEHYGFEPAQVPGLFADRGFVLETSRTFQLGLNHLFVFRRPAAS
ncbi:MAG: class I SAM-dependent methyltransferase [bacterium]|nr:class I SAM-dependent methyltransferase [bacterium]